MSVPSNLVPVTILQLPEDPSPSDLGWMMYVNNGVTYKVQVNAVLNVSGVPTTRQVNAGTGLTGGGDLSVNRTISVAVGGIGSTQLDNTGVTPGVYGSASELPILTVDANGRVTAATTTSFSVSGYVPVTRQVIAGTGLSGGGALNNNVTLNAVFSSATPLALGAATAGVANESARGDHVHPAVNLASTVQTTGVLGMVSGGTGVAHASPASGSIAYSDGSGIQLSTVGLVGQVFVSNGAGAPGWGSALIVSDQPANYFYAGPTTGVDAPTSFRAMVNADLPASGVSANTYGSASSVPVFAVNSKGVVTGVTNTTIAIGNANLANSSITINGNTVSLGGSTTVTATATNALTIGTGLSGTSYNGSSPVTVAIDSTVATLTGIQTLTNKTLTTPVIGTSMKLNGVGVASYTPFAETMASFVADDNNYKLVYIQNRNNGSDASADYVAYNDASDVDSYFIDMGIGSSNYTSAVYPIFPANAGYVYTGGGASGQASALLLGTSNAASDIVMFTGGVDTTNEAIRVSGADQTVEVQKGVTLNDTLDVTGAATFGSTVLLDANPTLALQAATKQYVDNQVTAGIHIHDPVRVETTGNLTATYVQGGTTFNITAITGTNTVTTSVNHGLVVNDQIWLTTTAGNGLSINTAYFVYSTPALNTLTLSLTYGGAQITGLTNATGLTYATRANSGVGATLTNAGVQSALSVDSVALSVGNRVMVRLQTNGAENGVYEVTTVGTILTNWVLTRTADASIVSPTDVNGLGTGDYFFTQEGALNAGDSHVLTTEPNTMIIGYTPLTYTQFSGGVTYVGGTNIDVTGQTISLTGTVAAINGGTGTSTVTTGDLLYGSATDTWSKLPLGVAYKSLIVNASGTQLEWNAVPLNQTTAVSGQLSVSNGGTGQSSYTNGQLLIGNTTGGTLAKSTLTAGTGINITNGSGTITITANIDGGTF